MDFEGTNLVKFINSGYFGCAALDCQFDFACQEPAFDALPLMEMAVNCDPVYSALDIDPSPCMFQGEK